MKTKPHSLMAAIFPNESFARFINVLRALRDCGTYFQVIMMESLMEPVVFMLTVII